MKPIPLKALLILGPDNTIPEEVIELYSNKLDYLIIGDGKQEDITIEKIEKKLIEKNFTLNNTRIDIHTHGNRFGENNKSHKITLNNKEDVPTQDFFKNLQRISIGALNVHLWACHGGTANKEAIFLDKGSSLITHVESANTAWSKLIDYSFQKSIERYTQNNFTAEEQFVADFPENFETMTYSKVLDNHNTIKYKTTRFLKDNKIADFLEVLKDSADLKSIVHNDIKLNKELFCKKLPQDIAKKAEKIEIKLNDEQVQNYITKRLMHTIHKKLTEENKETFRQVIKLLHKKGINFNNSPIKNTNILALASNKKNLEMVKIILPYIDINAIDSIGYTPLIGAINSDGSLEIIKELLAHPKIDVNAIDSIGYTPLIGAINSDGSLEIIKELLAHPKIDVNAIDSIGYTPLIGAINSDGSLEIIKELLAHPKIDVNAIDSIGYTPLIGAINSDGSLEIIKELLAHPKIDVNATTGWGYTPLDYAIKKDRLEVIKELLKQPKIQLSSNTTEKLLNWAMDKYQLEVIKQVLDNPKIELNSDTSEKLLTWAMDKYQPEVIENLLNHSNINVNIQNNEGQTLLHKAIMNKNKEIFQKLVEYPNIINIQDSDGEAPLHYAIDNIEMFQKLLEQPNINRNIQASEGQAPLHWATNNIEITNALLEYADININVQDNNGYTPLHYAALQGNKEVFQKLIEHHNMKIENINEQSFLELASLSPTGDPVEISSEILQLFKQQKIKNIVKEVPLECFKNVQKVEQPPSSTISPKKQESSHFRR